jgi:hypothetical protein
VAERAAAGTARVLVVWVPILDGDDRAAAGAACAAGDPAARCFWDEGRHLSDALGRSLAIPGPAWDVYLVYPGGARWEDGPPAPSSWMHQLSRPGPSGAPRLDGEALRVRLEQLVGR